MISAEVGRDRSSPAAMLSGVANVAIRSNVVWAIAGMAVASATADVRRASLCTVESPVLVRGPL